MGLKVVTLRLHVTRYYGGARSCGYFVNADGLNVTWNITQNIVVFAMAAKDFLVRVSPVGVFDSTATSEVIFLSMIKRT